MIEFTWIHVRKLCSCLKLSKSCLIAVHAWDADAASATRPVCGLALPALLAVAEEEEGGDDGHSDSHGEADHHELVHFRLFYACDVKCMYKC